MRRAHLLCALGLRSAQARLPALGKPPPCTLPVSLVESARVLCRRTWPPSSPTQSVSGGEELPRHLPAVTRIADVQYLFRSLESGARQPALLPGCLAVKCAIDQQEHVQDSHKPPAGSATVSRLCQAQLSRTRWLTQMGCSAETAASVSLSKMRFVCGHGEKLASCNLLEIASRLQLFDGTPAHICCPAMGRSSWSVSQLVTPEDSSHRSHGNGQYRQTVMVMLRLLDSSRATGLWPATRLRARLLPAQFKSWKHRFCESR